MSWHIPFALALALSFVGAATDCNAQSTFPEPTPEEKAAAKAQAEAAMERNPWLDELPAQLKKEMGRCIFDKGLHEAWLKYKDNPNPPPLPRYLDTHLAAIDKLGAREFADFELYCPETIEQLKQYIP
ncbi:hypothetical protein [Dongia sp.]|uniref:hypothetical protein n=1 Tax=Dongia sp. TaxID=1977262 RepID=UPI0035B0C629